jgi:type I restriction enzyme S subunit
MKHNWAYQRLGDIAPAKPFKGSIASADGKYWCLNLDKIESNTGVVLEYDFIEESELGGSVHKFTVDNVLFSKLRPNLNKVVVPEQNGYCTTELVPLHPLDILNRYYLAYYLRSPRYLNFLIGKTGGAKMPRVKMDIFWDSTIPVPPMEIQKQIVEEFDQINDLIAKNRELLSELDALAQSLFYDSFGDPLSNPKGFPIKTLKDVCVLKSGDSSANNLPDGDVPYVKVGDMNLIDNKRGIITSSNFVNIETKSKLLFPIGTTIFPKRGGAILTNKKRLTKVQICCDLNIMGAIPQNIHPLYLYFFFLEKDFSELVDGSTVPQINNTDIYPLKIQVPPLALQEEFASKVEAIEAQKVKVDAEISELQNLLDARMDYWFN